MRLVLIFAIHFSTRFIILTYLRSHYRQPSTRNASNTLVTSERIFAIHFSTRFIVNARIGFVQRMFSTRALRRSTLKAIYVHRLIVVRDIINFIQKTHIDDKFFYTFEDRSSSGTYVSSGLARPAASIRVSASLCLSL